MKFILPFFLFFSSLLYSQTSVDVFPDSIQGTINENYHAGIYFVPKTIEAKNDFFNNQSYFPIIRTNIVESALNNSSNISQCLAFLDTFKTDLIALSLKTDNFLFVVEKMPAWLSSSSDGSAAQTPGWYILNTKPPANYTVWNNVMDSIFRKIYVDFGITNLSVEIWNEPDLGSWTASESEYFELFKYTFLAIKGVNSNIAIGGPATNAWGNSIYYQPPFGYANNQTADSSLIGKLLDSAFSWGITLDFVSWHLYNTDYQAHLNAEGYIQQKCSSLGIPVPQLINTEWNINSAYRDTPLQKTFFLKTLQTYANSSIVSNVVGGWQDFSFSTNEFHNDYGLLSYGAIKKPVYNAFELAKKLKNNKVKVNTNGKDHIVACKSNDTLLVLINNYAPHPFVATFNHLLYEHQLNANQLDSAGYINIALSDFNYLDSLFKGLVSISSSDFISTAINASIPTYNHWDSVYDANRTFILSLNGFTNNYSGKIWVIDSNNNNKQFVYDSLRNNGYNQSSAISYITNNQDLKSDSISLIAGQISITLQPNAIALLEITVPEFLGLTNPILTNDVSFYPNPAFNNATLKSIKPFSELFIINSEGKMVKQLSFGTKTTSKEINLEGLKKGSYFIVVDGQSVPFIKN